MAWREVGRKAVSGERAVREESEGSDGSRKVNEEEGKCPIPNKPNHNPKH